MTKVRMIINRRAGQSNFDKFEAQILSLFREAFTDISCFDTSETGDAGRLALNHAMDTDMFVIAGGDGTVNEVINSIAPLPLRPVLAILPFGFHNHIARGLRVSTDPIEAAKQIIAKKTKFFDIGCDNGHYFLNFWGVGAISPKFDSELGGLKTTFEKMPYYWKTFKNAQTSQNFYYECASQNYFLAGRADFILVANNTFTSGFNQLIPSVDPEDALLDIIIIKEAKLSSFLSLMKHDTQLNAILPNDGIIHFQAESVRITTSPSHLINGDKSNPSFTEINACPHHLKIVVG